MAIEYTGHCPKHGQQQFLNDTCKQCSIEKEQEEKRRWDLLTHEEKLDELKQRIDTLESIPTKLGGI